MANTKIPVELSSTPGIVDNSNATAITIDASENVGIGTSSPVARLTVDGATTGFAASGITLKRTGSLTGSSDIILAGNSGSEALSFRVNQSEKLRIDSSGNLLVGTTSSPASGNPKAVKYGIGVQGSSLSSSVSVTANTATDMIDVSNVVSGTTGSGMYMISIVRDGGSYGTHFVGIFGLTFNSVVLYETLRSNGITVTVSGTTIRASCANTDIFLTNMIPLTIHN